MLSNKLKRPPKITQEKLYKDFSFLNVLTAAIITIGLIILIANYNLAATHDGVAHLQWGSSWTRQFLEGNIFPKWFEDTYGGLGSPSFIFYPPLFRTLQLPFAFFNFSPSQQIKGSYIIILIFNAIGVIKLSHLLFQKNRVSSWVSVFLGVFNPYLVICITKRGAAAEILAIAIIPWLMMGIYFVLSKGKIRQYLLLILAFATLAISHIPSSVTFGSSYVISLFILLVLGQVKWQRILILLIIPALALLVSAWFTFPVVFDTHLLGGVGKPPYEDWFLFYGFKLSLSPLGWENSLAKIFLLNCIIVFLTAILARPWQIKEPKHQLITQQLIMVAFSLFMMTDLSLWLYQSISVFQKIQFPWRFLTISSCVSPYLLSYSIESCTDKFPFLRKKILILAFLTALVLINYKSANFYLLKFDSNKRIDYIYTQRKNISKQVLTNATYNKLEDYLYVTLTGFRDPVYFTQDFNLYMTDVPWVLPNKISSENWLDAKKYGYKKGSRIPPKLYPSVELVQGKSMFSVEDWRSGFRQLKLDNNTEVVLNLNTFYYPGWAIQVNPKPTDNLEQPLMSPATDGRIQLKIPAGIYQVKIWYQGTLAERLGIIISFCSIPLLLLIAFSRRQLPLS